MPRFVITQGAAVPMDVRDGHQSPEVIEGIGGAGAQRREQARHLAGLVVLVAGPLAVAVRDVGDSAGRGVTQQPLLEAVRAGGLDAAPLGVVAEGIDGARGLGLREHPVVGVIAVVRHHADAVGHLDEIAAGVVGVARDELLGRPLEPDRHEAALRGGFEAERATRACMDDPLERARGAVLEAQSGLGTEPQGLQSVARGLGAAPEVQDPLGMRAAVVLELQVVSGAPQLHLMRRAEQLATGVEAAFRVLERVFDPLRVEIGEPLQCLTELVLEAMAPPGSQRRLGALGDERGAIEPLEDERKRAWDGEVEPGVEENP
ncbi:hypothetical protein OWM54_33255 [Myxococcus sp. MISCRS1]|nr:hypothetical protein [Myxococcus sp. MISCRS1]MCY1002032.1 hypothetical protein [Myxococcus sp. MISCRS1]